MTRFTLLKELDKIESELFKEQDSINNAQNTQNSKKEKFSNTVTKSPIKSIKSFFDFVSRDYIILLLVLVLFLHPTVNMYLNNTINLGGVTFLVKAILAIIVYIIAQNLL